MLKNSLLILLILGLGRISAQDLQLAPPQTPSTRLFAALGTKIDFNFRLLDAEIRYTTDGTEPTTESKIFTQPLEIKGPATLKAKSFKTGFLPSESITVQILPFHSRSIDSVGITPAPKKYPGNGWKTLCDKRLGDANFRQNWLGFEGGEIELDLFFTKKRPVSHIMVGLLRQQNAWIFLPATIEVYDEKGKLIASQALPDEALELADSMEIISVELPQHRHKYLKIKLIALPSLPAWHSGTGSTGWIFSDEIMAW
ncbi:MAG: chitobiase/beta-hexosaminidase C-terminal domain-containing protein [Saprospiraceae bacterium]|nr:chitobiase/beta-hexosaminidase C-terminal domain-containing protein [Saprospiraceae bacterium]MCF8250742.1 chitobiase/beta-hexosaminidase C-terminal domain-containing protein [Saprospiraceae bacterium]MCF8279799.1 chitobiase/beta-hexosaminidase C-terminal domain-containing protein [Bacteroidales bacterium]MCF8310496.1 chitobiase/beta-hexosaminidase C-terminal domain-containing protein [Saprospiraceae bacterium]MCF8440872.1 chitobiase/beta-hexosaminidase C-terminal domain-containing protein [